MMDVWSYGGASVDWDHILVVAELNQEIKKSKNIFTHRNKSNLESAYI